VDLSTESLVEYFGSVSSIGSLGFSKMARVPSKSMTAEAFLFYATRRQNTIVSKRMAPKVPFRELSC
jgi:hypothetical protein